MVAFATVEANHYLCQDLCECYIPLTLLAGRPQNLCSVSGQGWNLLGEEEKSVTQTLAFCKGEWHVRVLVGTRWLRLSLGFWSHCPVMLRAERQTRRKGSSGAPIGHMDYPIGTSSAQINMRPLSSGSVCSIRASLFVGWRHVRALGGEGRLWGMHYTGFGLGSDMGDLKMARLASRVGMGILIRDKVVHFGKVFRQNTRFVSCKSVHDRADHDRDASLQRLLVRAVVVLLQLTTKLASASYRMGNVRDLIITNMFQVERQDITYRYFIFC
jgi:hypothetical protein